MNKKAKEKLEEERTARKKLEMAENRIKFNYQNARVNAMQRGFGGGAAHHRVAAVAPTAAGAFVQGNAETNERVLPSFPHLQQQQQQLPLLVDAGPPPPLRQTGNVNERVTAAYAVYSSKQ